ncbi:hypothetical protein F5Y06DRAFT_44711 [Hypoxylon sp. FL0890]|nr:hypothetical protein F5Y06DRAFT_44711 [Hypoxylon sp. FL0890]
MSLRQLAVVAVLALASVSSATTEKPAQSPIAGTDTVHGCYKSVGTMKKLNTDTFNSQGACAGFCRDNNYVAGASNSYDCWCGDEYPNKADLVDDDECTEPCPGYGDDACGGLNTYTVYNTGKRVTVGEAAEAGSSSSSSAGASKTTSATSTPASTSDTIETITAPSDSNNKSSTNVAGIAAGVVVGVVVVSAIMGGGFFWMRRKRNAEIEEEHRRNAAVNAFISGGKPPSSSGGLSMSDSRLDPVMNRRMSDGSIADNQDYSRRILRVTNA